LRNCDCGLKKKLRMPTSAKHWLGEINMYSTRYDATIAGRNHWHGWVCWNRTRRLPFISSRPRRTNFLFRFRLQQTNGSCRFSLVPFSVYKTEIYIYIYVICIYIYIYTVYVYIYLYIYLYIHVFMYLLRCKTKTEAQAFFLNQFTVCSSYKRMLAVCERTKPIKRTKWTKWTCLSMGTRHSRAIFSLFPRSWVQPYSDRGHKPVNTVQ
jgi:hypothetical protein